jgi:hypothetical protein
LGKISGFRKIDLKLGRQTLSYDNERLVGSLDWAMQGRSFDALKGIYKFNPNSKLEAVVTYNNDDNDLNDLPEKKFTVLQKQEKSQNLYK